ncbi:VraH family protein [Staphylococcus chromogenes]|uniref:VraH family protein n=1 Tax=Staphylococcus chromogenes TaxID=46126 RepID=UPI001300BD33|nr:VraH family protein [Staphylococcus chromogenes]
MSINELIQKLMNYSWSLTDVIFLVFYPTLFYILLGPIIGIPAGIVFFTIMFIVDKEDQ